MKGETMKPAEAKKFLKENGVRYVLAQFVDVHGAAKAKSVPVEHYDTVISDGAGFAGFARFAGFEDEPGATGRTSRDRRFPPCHTWLWATRIAVLV